MSRGRRSFYHQTARRMAGTLLCLFLLGGTHPAAAKGKPPIPPETLVYDIDFMIFRNAAEGALRFRYLPDRNLYEGIVTAETKGFVGLLSFARKDRYRSLMRLSDDGVRLIPVEFAREVRTWGYRIRSRTTLDYGAGIMRWKATEVTGGETVEEDQSHPIPAGVVYEDFISAFFNLRRGAYGPIAPGRKIRLHTLPTRAWFKKKKNKPQYFDIRIEEPGEGRNSRARVHINVPKDLFGQKVGALQFLLRGDHIPSTVFVEDAVLFGDMRGRLREAVVRRPPPAPEIPLVVRRTQ